MFLQGLQQRNFPVLVQSAIGQAQSVLDIGCGIGEYLQYTRSGQRVVAIEPHIPYLQKANARAPWAEFHNTDALTYLRNASEQFDLVLLIDVVEHLDEPEARQLVREAIAHAKGAVLSLIPIGTHEQHDDAWNMGGEFWQTHRSTWNEVNVRGLGFTYVHVWKDFYDWDETVTHKSRDTSIAMWLSETVNPKFKIVVSNQEDHFHLREILCDIQNQLYPNFEVIIEQTKENKSLVDEFCLYDSRFYSYLSDEFQRLTSSQTPGPFVVTLNSDKRVYPFDLEMRLLQSKGEQKPIVSVVVPTHNQARYLDEALDSIRAQTYEYWEAVVVNDGSTDNTKEVIEKYERLDSRIRGIHKENGGIFSALNEGIAHARGQYFCWLSSDDLFNPQKLELQVKAFENLDESYAIVFGGFDLLDEKEGVKELKLKKPFTDGLEFPQCLKYDYIDGCTIMIPLTIMREMGGFNTNFKHAQDIELRFRLAAKGYRFHYIEQKLAKRRIHANQGFRDFELDCRLDEYWMVDFYLSRYRFRDFYKHVHFDHEEDLVKFLLHFVDMISEANCHINHPTIINKFWRWFLDGLQTLKPAVRNKILARGQAYFEENKQCSKHFKDYLARFNEAIKKLSNKRAKYFKPQTAFHDLTRFDKSHDESFTRRLFEYGKEKLKNLEQTAQNEATTIFKYVADVENPYQAKSYAEFYRLTFLTGNYDAYARSFSRKSNFANLPDEMKASYAWSQYSLGQPKERIEKTISLISDEQIKQHIFRWFDSEKVSSLLFNSIKQWNFSVVPYKIRYALDIVCERCQVEFNWEIVADLSLSPVQSQLICPHCFTSYQFTDEHLAQYFEERTPPSPTKQQKTGKAPQVAIVMRYSNFIGGGVKMVFKHATWLKKLGCEVTIYSDAPAPTWTSLPGKFVRVNDHYEIPKTDYDLVVVMCAYDIPKMLTKYPADRVALFCQGYEGYHIGKDYNELRSDKHFYTQLHSLPAKKVVVSKHLVELFQTKFGHTSYYVPNGINHSVFYPEDAPLKEPNSLLFIGNPNDPLKGLVFLIRTLEEIQKSQFKIDGLVLHVVSGGIQQGAAEKVVPMPGFQVTYHEGLASKDVAKLINQVEVVVNTSWYEGFSLPVLEAMACGTPVITTDNMGAESFCTDGVNSFVVKYTDMNRLGNIILNILNHKIDVADMVKQGLVTASQYSEERSLRRFIAAYEELLERSFPKERVENLLASVHANPNVPVQTNGTKEQKTARRQGPLFSVMVPTYNQAHYLPYALNSLRAQTYQNWEAIVVDDGSTDNTRKVMERYAALDKRVHCVHKSNGGVASALNEALKHAKGEWICWLSTDDLFEPEKLSVHEEERIKNPDIKFFYTHFYVLDESTSQKLAGDPDLVKFQPSYTDSVISFFYTNYVNGISVCIHRSVFEKVWGFNERFHHGQDFDLWLRISSLFPSKFINHRTCVTRIHSGQGTSIFPEAGIFDSAQSCLDFLNTHDFSALFPRVNLSDKKALYHAVEKALAVAGDPKAFINRLGYANVLLDRFHEWCSQSCPQLLRKALRAQINNVIASALSSDIPEHIKRAFITLQGATEDNFVYHPYEPLATAERFMNGLRSKGQVLEASVIQKYLDMRKTKESVQPKFRMLLLEAYELTTAEQFEASLSKIAESVLEYEKIAMTDMRFEEDLFNLRGVCYLRLKDLVQAKCAFEETLKISPNSSEACVGLGNIFYLAEMDKESKTMFEWAVKNDPNNQAAVEGLIKINTQLGLVSLHSSLNEAPVSEEPAQVDTAI